MGKAVLRAGLWLLLPVALLGQSNGAPKAEVYTGYSYLRIEGSDLHGGNIAIAGYVNDNLGIVGEFTGHFNEESSSIGAAQTTSSLNLISAMGGVHVTDRSKGWIAPFAHALFGATRINADVRVSQPGFPSSVTNNATTGFTTALGGGLDISMAMVGIRLIQADFLLIRSDGFKHEGARLSAGLVWRFGQR